MEEGRKEGRTGSLRAVLLPMLLIVAAAVSEKKERALAMPPRKTPTSWGNYLFTYENVVRCTRCTYYVLYVFERYLCRHIYYRVLTDIAEALIDWSFQSL